MNTTYFTEEDLLSIQKYSDVYFDEDFHEISQKIKTEDGITNCILTSFLGYNYYEVCCYIGNKKIKSAQYNDKKSAITAFNQLIGEGILIAEDSVSSQNLNNTFVQDFFGVLKLLKVIRKKTYIID